MQFKKIVEFPHHRLSRRDNSESLSGRANTHTYTHTYTDAVNRKSVNGNEERA